MLDIEKLEKLGADTAATWLAECETECPESHLRTLRKCLASPAAWSEGLVNALGTKETCELFGLPERAAEDETEEWCAALRAYNRGAHQYMAQLYESLRRADEA